MKVIKNANMTKTMNERVSRKNNEDGTSENVSFSFFVFCNVSLLLHVYEWSF